MEQIFQCFVERGPRLNAVMGAWDRLLWPEESKDLTALHLVFEGPVNAERLIDVFVRRVSGNGAGELRLDFKCDGDWGELGLTALVVLVRRHASQFGRLRLTGLDTPTMWRLRRRWGDDFMGAGWSCRWRGDGLTLERSEVALV